jgi:hypothetical protein
MMRRRWISALVGLAGASTGFEVLAAEYVQILEAPAPPAQLPLGEILGTHDGDMIGVMPGEFVLIRQGAIVKRFSVDGMSPSKSSTGPKGHVYLLFAGSLGGVVKVIDPAGSLVREIVCPELVNPIAFAVDSTGGFVALVRPAPDVEDPQPLLYRFDAAGSLLSTQLPGEVGRSRQMFRIAAGEGGEVALLRADEEMVYWLDAEGNEVLKVAAPASSLITALGFVDGRLGVIRNRAVPKPAPEGVFAYRLESPELVLYNRDGTTTTVPLPEEAVGANHIAPDGSVLRADQAGVRLFARHAR